MHSKSSLHVQRWDCQNQSQGGYKFSQPYCKVWELVSDHAVTQRSMRVELKKVSFLCRVWLRFGSCHKLQKLGLISRCNALVTSEIFAVLPPSLRALSLGNIDSMPGNGLLLTHLTALTSLSLTWIDTFTGNILNEVIYFSPYVISFGMHQIPCRNACKTSRKLLQILKSTRTSRVGLAGRQGLALEWTKAELHIHTDSLRARLEEFLMLNRIL